MQRDDTTWLVTNSDYRRLLDGLQVSLNLNTIGFVLGETIRVSYDAASKRTPTLQARVREITMRDVESVTAGMTRFLVVVQVPIHARI